jgi:hypothetical protein
VVHSKEDVHVKIIMYGYGDAHPSIVRARTNVTMHVHKWRACLGFDLVQPLLQIARHRHDVLVMGVCEHLIKYLGLVLRLGRVGVVVLKQSSEHNGERMQRLRSRIDGRSDWEF